MNYPNNIRAEIRTEVVDRLRSIETKLNSCVRDQCPDAFGIVGIHHQISEINLNIMNHAADIVEEWLNRVYFKK